MEWISVDERLPEVGTKCWYFFDVVGSHRGFYGGLYEDEEGKVWPSMSIFYCDYGFLTGDVTHWHSDQEERPIDPV
tara:strand:+ start:10343 stop:10570 length:228 start_codon:yes stop_codon:yes gene_type:complete